MVRLGRWSTASVFVLGMVFQVVFFVSIFDIYFQSPLVTGVAPVGYPASAGGAPAKRVVLFVADGLRADTLFGNPEVAPFLHSVVHSGGSFGVSHTHVPTESRPGHVALLAGFYEDVSAVTKGWAANPVEFDSVLNRSSAAYAFGSPDIVPMFVDPVPHAHGDTYDSAMEDFALASSSSTLDEWVFDKVAALFEDPASVFPDAGLEVADLGKEGSFFFLHLLGIDTAGHAKRPASDAYVENLRDVDKGVERMVALFEDAYGPAAASGTVFVFTADHGMSNRGSHGDGDPDNTMTPLIVWGAGAKRPVKSPAGRRGKARRGFARRDPESWDPSLEGLDRKDVEQANVAALMASLLGVPYPTNSVGLLPVEYLNVPMPYKLGAMMTNARAMYEQFVTKSGQVRDRVLLFKPFVPLMFGSAYFSKIEAFIRDGHPNQAIDMARSLVKLSQEGLRYLVTYDWAFLMSFVILGYLAFGLLMGLYVMERYGLGPVDIQMLEGEAEKPRFKSYVGFVNVITFIVFLVLFSWMYLESTPVMHYLYVGIPIVLVSLLSKAQVLGVMNAALGDSNKDALLRLGILVGVVGYLELIVWSYFERGIYALCFAGLALWPLLGSIVPGVWVSSSSLPYLTGVWVTSCLGLGSFTLLPIELESSLGLVVAGGVCGLVLVGLLIEALPEVPGVLHSVDADGSRQLLRGQMVVVGLALGLLAHTESLLESEISLPLANQVGAWGLVVVGLCLPVFSPRVWMWRMVSVYLGLAPGMVLLSVHYEMLFYSVLLVNLLAWILVEAEVRAGSDDGGGGFSGGMKRLGLGDLRTGGMFLLYINVAFFGTGNVASLSSFEISSAFRFVTIFTPWLMGALLIFKVLIPIALVSAALGFVGRVARVPPMALFFLVVTMSSVCSLNFFFLIRTEGASWKEIGNSISHFAIQNAFQLLLSVLYALANVVTLGAGIPGGVGRLHAD